MTKTLISLFSTRRMLTISALVFCVLSSSALAASSKLLDVRVGTHRQHDRLVMELDRQVKYRINTDDPEKLTVRLFDANASNTFVLPDLQKNLAFIKGVEAYLIGTSDIEIDIALAKQTEQKVLVLEGSPWRLVVDISEMEIIPPADASKPVQHEEPEYIPGDKPIETRYAEQHTEPETSPTAVDTTDGKFAKAIDEVLEKIASAEDFSDSLPLIPEPTQEEMVQLEEQQTTEPHSDAALDENEKINTVLRHYYLAIGDTESATAFGYPDVHDQLLSDELEESMQSAGISVTLAAMIYQMPWLILVAALLTGTVGGVFGFWIFSRSFSLKLPKRNPKTKEEKAPVSVEEPEAKEIEQDMDSLESAVEQEPQPEPEEVPVPEPEPVLEAEEGAEADAAADEELKETAMERRVKRVLDLSKSGADIESIAKQLEMSQDEVKLILDLN